MKPNKPESDRSRSNKPKDDSVGIGGGNGGSGSAGAGAAGMRPGEAEIMVDIAMDACKELFIDQYELPYAALKIDGRMETIGMGKKRFKNFLGGTFYEETGIVPSAETITSAIGILKYKAGFKGGRRILYERIAIEEPSNISSSNSSSNNNSNIRSILYDLTNPKWECVKITPFSWQIIADPPIIFRRHGNEHPQVYPVKKYPKNIFDEFMDLLNIKADENKLLVKCYIISLFIPEIQIPILMLHGEQGAAKSTLQEIIKTLVDPRAVLTLAFPSKQEEMVQQLSHHYVAYYDNISQIKEWISNILCRSVTGSGFSKRQLYTDDDDIIYNYKRAIGFDGINLAATKADLLDRGLIVLLDRLTEQQQKNISEIWEKFHKIRPKLLAYIFDTLVMALNMNLNNPVKLEKLPRMSQFAIWGETISRCMGNYDNAFTDAFKRNRRLQAAQILETSPVAMVLNEFMEDTIEDVEKGYETVDIQKHFEYLTLVNEGKYQWKGSATELLRQLTIKALNIGVSTKAVEFWPGAPHVLSRRLTEVRATLKEIGISIEFENDVGREKKREIIVTKIASPASPTSPDENHAQNEAKSGDPTNEGDASSVSGQQVASLKKPENRAQNQPGGARDARDAILGNNFSHTAFTCKLCDLKTSSRFDYRWHMEIRMGLNGI